ncbi:CGNR zinc finger domain-containing protein [Nonomuraea cavernae]|uniref:CGNR zinc finger domain-containing protein n=1 Tax=Nonomuraea cavernae TaxID=2045107 RepID=UPI0033C61515
MDVELVGNALCLDFANTVNARPVARSDWLADEREAETWAHAAGHPIEDAAGLAAALPAAREFREAVFRVFQPLAHGERPPRADLDAVAAMYADGVARGRLTAGPSGDGPSGEGPSGEGPSGDGPSGEGPSGEGPSGDGPSGEGPSGDGPSGEGSRDRYYRFTWDGPRTARVLLWEVAASAVELLGHGPLGRLGECPSCCWLFLDTSRNNRRRWCSMTTCGSRDKSRRYYATRPAEP